MSGMMNVERKESSREECDPAWENDDPPSLIEACESVCRALGGAPPYAGEDHLLQDWDGILALQIVSRKGAPSAGMLRRINWIARTKALDWRAMQAKKLAVHYFAESYGDPANILVILLKSVCEDLDLGRDQGEPLIRGEMP